MSSLYIEKDHIPQDHWNEYVVEACIKLRDGMDLRDTEKVIQEQMADRYYSELQNLQIGVLTMSELLLEVLGAADYSTIAEYVVEDACEVIRLEQAQTMPIVLDERYKEPAKQLQNNKLVKVAWPGLYTMLYLNHKDEPFCGHCANESDVRYQLVSGTTYDEGPAFECTYCNEEVEASYGNPYNEDAPVAG